MRKLEKYVGQIMRKKDACDSFKGDVASKFVINAILLNLSAFNRPCTVFTEKVITSIVFQFGFWQTINLELWHKGDEKFNLNRRVGSEKN